MSTSTLPALPDGWVQQYDAQSKHPFWVDTNAKPPRSIWIHPYEDEQYLNSHPDMRDRIAAARKNRPSSDNPPPYSPRRHSISGESGRPGPSTNNLDVPVERRNATSQPGTPPPVTGKRGFFDRLKDKASGRDDQSGSRDRGLLHHRHHQSQQAYGPQYGRSDYAQPTHYAQQPMYGPPAGDPYAVSGGRYRRGFGGLGGGLGGLGGGLGGLGGGLGGLGGGLGGMGGRMGGLGGRHGGFGGAGLPLLGGMAGGLVLGDVLGGFGDRGGLFGGPGYGDPFGQGFGGGPFDGPFDNGYGGGFDGGFGGGGFDGGGFDGDW